MVIEKISYYKQSSDSAHIVSMESHTKRIRGKSDLVVDNDRHDMFVSEDLSSSFSIFGKCNKIIWSKFYKLFSNHIPSAESLFSKPLPIAVRALSANTYMIERPPFKTNVRLSFSRANRVKQEANSFCEIWIPWTVSFLTLNPLDESCPSLRMYYNDGPVTSLDDILTPAWTANIHSSNEICFGSTVDAWYEAIGNKTINKNNVNDVYNFLINEYFSGGWNLDLGAGKITEICRQNVGHFVRNIFNNENLLKVADSLKIKFKKYSFLSSSLSNVKNYYLTWSLLELSQVLNSVSYIKESNENPYGYGNKISLKQLWEPILSDNQMHEQEIIKHINDRINQNSFESISDWLIEINFNSDLIRPYFNILLEKEHVETSYVSKIYLEDLVKKATANFILDNLTKIIEIIESSLDKISDKFLLNYDSCQHQDLLESINFDSHNVFELLENGELLHDNNV